MSTHDVVEVPAETLATVAGGTHHEEFPDRLDPFSYPRPQQFPDRAKPYPVGRGNI
jgi:hypothetical protein